MSTAEPGPAGHCPPGRARRVGSGAGIRLGEEYHQHSRMTTITGAASRARTRHGFATIMLTGDIRGD